VVYSLYLIMLNLSREFATHAGFLSETFRWEGGDRMYTPTNPHPIKDAPTSLSILLGTLCMVGRYKAGVVMITSNMPHTLSLFSDVP